MLASMPSKSLADKFVVRFFETYDPSVPGVRMMFSSVLSTITSNEHRYHPQANLC